MFNNWSDLLPTAKKELKKTFASAKLAFWNKTPLRQSSKPSPSLSLISMF